MKCLGDGIMIICVYGQDVESNGALFASALREVHIGLVVMHIVLMNQSYWNNSVSLFIVNLAMVAAILGLNLILRYYRVSNIHNMAKCYQHLKFIKPTCVDKTEWVYRYCHPLIKKLPNFPHVIRELNPEEDAGPVTGSLQQDGPVAHVSKKTDNEIDLSTILRVEHGVRELMHSQSIIDDELVFTKQQSDDLNWKKLSRANSYHVEEEDVQIDEEEMRFNLSKHARRDPKVLDRKDKPVPFGSFGLATEKTLNPHNRRKVYKRNLGLFPSIKSRNRNQSDLRESLRSPQHNTSQDLI